MQSMDIKLHRPVNLKTKILGLYFIIRIPWDYYGSERNGIPSARKKCRSLFTEQGIRNKNVVRYTKNMHEKLACLICGVLCNHDKQIACVGTRWH